MIKYILPVCFLLLMACKEEKGTPKPRAYPRVEYPEKTYVTYSDPTCPFTFEYPGYAEISPKDSVCWFDLAMPKLNARIHCSYIPIDSKEEFMDLVKDAFRIADKINERSNFMEEARVGNDAGVNGLMFTWTGAAASPVHFFLTDTTEHFFKGALYFNTVVRPDSLAPVSAFLKEDVDKLISTFRWRK